MERRFSLLFRAVCLSALLVLVSFPAVAAEFRLTSETLLRGFERETADGEDVAVPLYQYLRADVGREGEQSLTFHLNGWGRIDLAGSDYFRNRFADDNDTAGELLYGYLQYDHPGTSATMRLGRQYVFEGVANESFDGLRFDSALTDLFEISAYGGWPVALDATDGRSGDSIYGGRLAHHLRGWYEIGLSYKSVDNDDNRAEEMLGFDASLFLPGVSFYGTSTRNLETEGWAEHFYEARFNLAQFQIRPFFERYAYEDYFGTGANTGGPFRFLAAFGEELTVFGADLLWKPTDTWEWGLKAKNFDYDRRGGSSPFLSGIAVWHGEGLTQAGGELGRMQGDRDEDRYVLGRAFVYQDPLPERCPFRFATADLVYVWYDEEIFNEDFSLFTSIGGGTRLLKNDALELKLSADYSINPYFDDDLRGWLLASYAFSL